MNHRKRQQDAGLTVLAPGLLGPVPLLPEQVPATPLLDLIFRRGRPRQAPQSWFQSKAQAQAPAQVQAAAAAPERAPVSTKAAPISLTSYLLQLFGAASSAPYALAADDPSWDRQGVVLQADPVHLRADRDQLRLFDARHLGISQVEADAFVDAINAHLAEDGLRLLAPVASLVSATARTPPARDLSARNGDWSPSRWLPAERRRCAALGGAAD